MRALLLCERAPCLQLSPSCLELQPRVRGWLLASVDGETTGSSQPTTWRSSARKETAGSQMWRGSLRPSRQTRRHPKQPQLHKSVPLLQPINIQHLPASCTVHEWPISSFSSVSSDSLGSAVSPSCVQFPRFPLCVFIVVMAKQSFLKLWSFCWKTIHYWKLFNTALSGDIWWSKIWRAAWIYKKIELRHYDCPL